MHAAYPGECHKLTPREKGLLGSLRTYQSEAGFAYDGEEVLEYALRNWDGLAAMARDWYGGYRLPERPTFDFLFKHARAVVQLWLATNKLEYRDGFVVPIPLQHDAHVTAYRIELPRLSSEQVRKRQAEMRCFSEEASKERTQVTASKSGSPRPMTLAELLADPEDDEPQS